MARTRALSASSRVPAIFCGTMPASDPPLGPFAAPPFRRRAVLRHRGYRGRHGLDRARTPGRVRTRGTVALGTDRVRPPPARCLGNSARRRNPPPRLQRSLQLLPARAAIHAPSPRSRSRPVPRAACPGHAPRRQPRAARRSAPGRARGGSRSPLISPPTRP